MRTKLSWIFALLAAQLAGAQTVLKVAPRQGPITSSPIEAALMEAKKLRSNDPSSQVVIELADGYYQLQKPLIFTPSDSGASPDAPLLIKPAPGAKPVVSGGTRLQGFKKAPGNTNLWTVHLPDVKEGKQYFRDLFVNGKRAQRARHPNNGYFQIQGESPQDKPVKIKYQEGSVKKEWADLGDVELVALLAWADLRMQIRSVDDTNRIATLSGEPRPSNKESHARYYIENAPEALDAPGEFYLDRNTGILSYLARPDENLSESEIIVPQLTELIRFEADFPAGKRVENIEISGIGFAHTGWTLPDSGYADTQAAIGVRGTLFAEGVSNLVIRDCSFSHLAGYAIELGKGAQNCKIINNQIHDLGAGGIRVGETAKRSQPFEQNHGHTITDNRIYNGGLIFPAAVGIFILQSGTNYVAHNHIHHLNYTAISVGWNWGYQETPCRENIIEFNHLHDIGQGKLSDMGAVYTLGIQKGTVIRNNLIHDVTSHGYGGWGLYPDEGSSDILWENNVVYRCKSAGFHQHYGRENIVRNNIFALNREYQLMRTREESHLSFIFTNNIVFWEGSQLLGSNWGNDRFTMDGNLYFEASGREVRFGNATFEQWKKRGHDTNSMIADPKFIGPKEGNFQLSPGSPALKLGFKPIDTTKVGPRK